MRYVILLSLVLAGAAHAQPIQGPITGPAAAPRVPEASTDAPIRAPGPATGSPTAAGPTTGAVEPPTPNSDASTSGLGASSVITPGPNNFTTPSKDGRRFPTDPINNDP
jgi:hypothetical protein